ncbi:MAG: tRNA pseudouridine(54/55) synthase Pus10 [Candidatus Micrarchaeota archaeon]
MSNSIFHSIPLCARCLRRQYALSTLPEEKLPSTSEKCAVCKEEIFSQIPALIALALSKTSSLEFSNFLVGVRVRDESVKLEEELQTANKLTSAESIKRELKREIGKELEKQLKKPAEFETPEVIFLFDFVRRNVVLQLQPLYIFGHYQKLSRTLCQSKWQCRKCRGKGCMHCAGKGKMYTSVEDIIGAVLLKKTLGKETSLHASGREDVDARMLGNGRPFIFEISEPKKRKFSLTLLARAINKAGRNRVRVVGKLKFVKKDAVRPLTSARLDKVYKATAKVDKKLSKADLKKIPKSVSLAQNTPTRVLHRRADLNRKREIKEIRAKLLSPTKLELVITAEAGSYIKEFISGDSGRTIPSISSLLGCKAICTQLDVIEIKSAPIDALI